MYEQDVLNLLLEPISCGKLCMRGHQNDRQADIYWRNEEGNYEQHSRFHCLLLPLVYISSLCSKSVNKATMDTYRYTKPLHVLLKIYLDFPEEETPHLAVKAK